MQFLSWLRVTIVVINTYITTSLRFLKHFVMPIVQFVIIITTMYTRAFVHVALMMITALHVMEVLVLHFG